MGVFFLAVFTFQRLCRGHTSHQCPGLHQKFTYRSRWMKGLVALEVGVALEYAVTKAVAREDAAGCAVARDGACFL